MKTSDLDAAMEVDALCLPAPWTAGIWKTELESPLGFHLVAEEKGRILGQIGVKNILDELHITTLAVRPENRRSGVARNLVEAAIEEFPDTKEVYLEVRPGNDAARRFYGSLGFRDTGRRPRYYGDEDAVLMTLSLRSH
ncbi:MAG: ribosomal protein S18-alanine N-acetyltransferase [Rubrobacter sp.]|nr:ribosomal protein S18-alanine N-acetyltransferase [Rubrobacter sp.]